MLMPPTNAQFALSLTQPIGGQLVESLRGRIVRGELRPGMRLSKHRAVAEAIAARDPGAAEAAIRRHLRGMLEGSAVDRRGTAGLFRDQAGPARLEPSIRRGIS